MWAFLYLIYSNKILFFSEYSRKKFISCTDLKLRKLLELNESFNSCKAPCRFRSKLLPSTIAGPKIIFYPALIYLTQLARPNKQTAPLGKGGVGTFWGQSQFFRWLIWVSSARAAKASSVAAIASRCGHDREGAIDLLSLSLSASKRSS